MRSLWLPLLFVLLRASRPTEAARAGTTHGGQRQQPPPLLRPSHVGPRTRRRGGRPPCSAVEAFVKEAAEEVRVAFNVTGLSVGVICNHSIVFQGGFGMADKEAGREATEHSLYQIASNTKAFTATLMLQLQEEGKISIDEPLRDASPSFRFFDRAGNEDLTPRDLLSHRTGLPRHDRVTFGSPSRAALMRNMAWLALDKPVRYQPGEYNNMMLAAAGVAEEAVTGQSWEDLVSERIFRPLNMSNSFANWSMVSPGAAALLAQPYRGGVRTDRSNADVAGPCGAIVSSVADFLKWQGMHLRQSARACVRSDSGAPFTNGPISRVTCQTSLAAAAAAAESGPFLLSDGSWSQLLVPNTIFPDFSEFGTYTLGLWWESYAEEFVLHHAGDLAGMASKQAMLPMLGHSIVVLSNENESPARFVIQFLVLDFLLGLEPPQGGGWQQRYTAAAAAQRRSDELADARRRAAVAALPAEAARPRWALSRYCGSYAHPAYGNATISVSKGGETLAGALQVCGAATIWNEGESRPAVPACASLFHVGWETFAVGIRQLSQLREGSTSLSFISDPASGAVTQLTADLEPAVDPIVFSSSSYRTKAQGYSWPL